MRKGWTRESVGTWGSPEATQCVAPLRREGLELNLHYRI